MGSDLGDDLNDIILKMNLFCITLHEFSHARLRQCQNDPNCCTPNLLANNPELVATFGGSPEFGRLAEFRFFGQQFDFWNTQREKKWTNAHSAYCTSFIRAIEMNEHLPPFDIDKTPCSIRSSLCSIGSDMDIEERDIC